ncbi:MAG: hypothetical protein AAGJ31_06700, partial [Verrucomicrobiota bacterium]
MLTPPRILDHHYLEARRDLLEVAALLDRYDAAVARVDTPVKLTESNFPSAMAYYTGLLLREASNWHQACDAFAQGARQAALWIKDVGQERDSPHGQLHLLQQLLRLHQQGLHHEVRRLSRRQPWLPKTSSFSWHRDVCRLADARVEQLLQQDAEASAQAAAEQLLGTDGEGSLPHGTWQE